MLDGVSTGLVHWIAAGNVSPDLVDRVVAAGHDAAGRHCILVVDHDQVTLVALGEFDLALAREVLARRLPVLGVCYGCQLLAVAGGGVLWQDIPSQVEGARDHGGEPCAQVT